MALTIQRGEALPSGLRADRRLYLTSDDRLVEHGNTECAFLLAAPGHVIPAATAARLDLRIRDGRVVQGPEPEQEPVIVELSPEPVRPPEVEVPPLADIVHPAGAMPEPVPEPVVVEPPIAPVMEPETRRRRGARG